MILMSIDNVKSGDILAQSVLGPDGCPMLRQGTGLSEKYVEKLKELGMAYVYIFHPKLEDIIPTNMTFFELKSKALKTLSNIFTRIQYNDNKYIKDVVPLVSEIVDYLQDNNEIDPTYLLELKNYNNYLLIHSLNTSILSIFMGISLKYSKSMLMDLGTGMILHDIGKIKVPPQILNKKEELTKEEFNIISKHPVLGYDIVRNSKDISTISKAIILEHHERIDGQGYPRRISSDSISKYGKIAAICDVYDAIISNKIYKKAFPLNEAYEFVLGGAGTMFDAELVSVFRNNFSIYPIGAGCRLSDGTLGYIIGHNKGFPDRPVLRVLYDKFDRVVMPYDVDLIKKIDMRIEKMIV